MADPFRYSQYQSPYVSSISQLIAAPGEARARAAEVAGNAQANAALQSGNAWAGAAQNIGQAIGAIPQQIQQYKAQEQQAQFRRAQIADMQAQQQQREAAAARQQNLDKANQAIDGIMQNSMKPDATTGVLSFDRPTFEQGLIQGGMGHLYPTLAETLDKLDASASKRNAEGRNMLAHSLLGVQQAGFTPDSVLSAAAYLKGNNVITAAQLQPVLSAIADDPSPENVKRVVTTLGQQIPEYQSLQKEEEKRAADLAKSRADTAHLSAEAAKLQAEVAGTLPETPTQKATRLHQEATLKVQQDAERRQAAELAERARHDRALEAANNPLAALMGAPSAPAAAVGPVTAGTPQGAAPVPAQAAPQTQGPTGEDFLNVLRGKGEGGAAIANEVKAYAEGRRPFPTGFALKSPYFQSLIQMVGQYDPTFDAANYNARNTARRDLTNANSKGGQTINALNTAVQHAGELSDLIEKLNNYNIPAANAIVNPLRTAVGKTPVTNFNTVAPQLMKEIERAWRGTGGSTADIKDLIASIGPNMGQQAQREALNEFVTLLQGKLSTTEQQRDIVLGAAGKDIPVLYDKNKAIIEKIQQRSGGQAAQGATYHLVNGQWVKQ